MTSLEESFRNLYSMILLILFKNNLINYFEKAIALTNK